MQMNLLISFQKPIEANCQQIILILHATLRGMYYGYAFACFHKHGFCIHGCVSSSGHAIARARPAEAVFLSGLPNITGDGFEHTIRIRCSMVSRQISCIL